jgi:hypothetical protein
MSTSSPSKALNAASRHSPDVVPAGDVALHQGGLPAELLDAGERLLSTGLRAAVVDPDPGTLLRRSHRDLGPEAGPGTGDEHRPPREALCDDGTGRACHVVPPEGQLLWLMLMG